MTLELLAMLAGSVTGFLMKLIGSVVSANNKNVELLIKDRESISDSADRASARGGVFVRRFISASIIFAVIIFPFVLSFYNIPIVVEKDPGNFIFRFFSGLFGNNQWEQVHGFILLPEVRQGMLAILGFYFGSSQVR